MLEISRNAIVILLLIAVVVSVTGAFLIVNEIGGEKPQEIGRASGEVRLYVMPQPTIESAEIKLDVISKEDR